MSSGFYLSECRGPEGVFIQKPLAGRWGPQLLIGAEGLHRRISDTNGCILSTGLSEPPLLPVGRPPAPPAAVRLFSSSTMKLSMAGSVVHLPPGLSRPAVWHSVSLVALNKARPAIGVASESLPARHSMNFRQLWCRSDAAFCLRCPSAATGLSMISSLELTNRITNAATSALSSWQAHFIPFVGCSQS